MSHDDLDENRQGERHRRRGDADPAASNDRPAAPAPQADAERRRGVVVPLGRARGRASWPPHGGPDDDDPGPAAA
ncbi:MAG TPA: hypothetical protein VF322_00890 [Gammaproteobacteria bacterium]